MFSSVNNENRIFVTFELEDNRKSNVIVLRICVSGLYLIGRKKESEELIFIVKLKFHY